MRFNTFTLTLSFVLLCTFVFLSGCEEQTVRRERLDQDWFNQPVWDQVRSSSGQQNSRIQELSSRTDAKNIKGNSTQPVPAPVTNIAQNNNAPKIRFDKLSHDFGQISPGSKNNFCEFNFTNVGTGDLIISDPTTSCSCTLVTLEDDKKVYAPGESGKIIALYYDTQLGQSIRHIYLNSNDPENSKTELAVKVELVAPVDYEPKQLRLSMIADNGDCPKITIASMDGQPFSITGFESNGGCITANFNPNKKATQFVLEPKVDMQKLMSNPEGNFRINISHPNCEVVSGTFYMPPRFSVSPRRIVINQADPSRTVVRTINVTSNYNEDFNVETALSDRGIMSIRDTRRTQNGYQVTVEITPPSSNGSAMFSQDISLSLPGIGGFTIPCNGYYPGSVAPAFPEEECKTCGPVRLDRPSMSLHPR